MVYKMSDQYSLSNIDSLLFQLALQTRELSRKKNEINHQIKGFRAGIAERKSYIERIHINIKKLEEEIKIKQNTLVHYKANVKRMMVSTSLLRHYEQALKEELESRKASYNHDMKVYEERLANYRKTFESHKDHYCQSPLAQKLLTLQAEKEEIESRIKACDDEITMKQKELDHLTAVGSSASEDVTLSVSDQLFIKEPAKHLNPDNQEECNSSTDISFLHLSQTEISQDAHKTHDEIQGTTANPTSPEEAGGGVQYCEQLNEPIWKDGVYTTEQSQEIVPVDQIMEQRSEVQDIVEAQMEESEAVEEEQPQGKEHDETLNVFPQSSSYEANPPSSPATVKAVPSTSTFPFTFSPGGSPHRETPVTKSTAFPFSLNSEPSTPAFSGFGFDESLSQDEDSSFTFTGSFLKEKKSTETKASSCPSFLFDHQEEGEAFQFAFPSKSPQTTQEGSGDDFQFSFNF